MNILAIMKGSKELFVLESSYIPAIGELIWFNSEIDNIEYYKVVGHVVSLDKRRRRFDVTLMVE